MAAIDPAALRKAMDGAGVTRARLANEVGLSLQYVCDITAGRRLLKRRPDLRRRIAAALDVPIHWIERPEELAS